MCYQSKFNLLLYTIFKYCFVPFFFFSNSTCLLTKNYNTELRAIYTTIHINNNVCSNYLYNIHTNCTLKMCLIDWM